MVTRTFKEEFFPESPKPDHIIFKIGFVTLVISMIIYVYPKLFQVLAVNLNDFHIWQPFTAIFVYLSPASVFFAFTGLWMFGQHVEAAIGERNFLKYFLLCGVSANIFWVVCSYLFLDSSYDLAFGFGGAKYGIIYAYAFFYPNRRVTYELLVIPARVFALSYGIMALVLVFLRPLGGPDSFLELFGMAIGAIYLDVTNSGPVTRYVRRHTRIRKC